LIGAGIICAGIMARVGYYLSGEATPTTGKAVAEGYTYTVSSRIDGTIAGIFVSNRQHMKAGELLAEIDKRDLEAKLAAARTDLDQAKTMLPEIQTQVSRAQAELGIAESRMSYRNRQLIEATSDYQYVSKIRTRKGVSPLIFSRAEKEYEGALSEYSRAKMAIVPEKFRNFRIRIYPRCKQLRQRCGKPKPTFCLPRSTRRRTGTSFLEKQTLHIASRRTNPC
jgi:membrane fusion protein (multidrug efflux system)